MSGVPARRARHGAAPGDWPGCGGNEAGASASRTGKIFLIPPLTWYKLNMATAGPPIILAAYICGPCDIRGRDREVSPGLVLCWNCGCPAVITARVAG
jgi:hypothetical protein